MEASPTKILKGEITDLPLYFSFLFEYLIFFLDLFFLVSSRMREEPKHNFSYLVFYIQRQNQVHQENILKHMLPTDSGHNLSYPLLLKIIKKYRDALIVTHNTSSDFLLFVFSLPLHLFSFVLLYR